MNLIQKAYTTITGTNEVSGHSWSVQGEFIGWEVYGGRWCRQIFKSEQAAIIERDLRDSLDILIKAII